MLRADICIELAGRQWTMVAHAIKSLTDAENEVLSYIIRFFLAMKRPRVILTSLQLPVRPAVHCPISSHGASISSPNGYTAMRSKIWMIL